MWTLLYYIVVALVTVYSIHRQRQLAKRMREAQDAAKGFELPVEAVVKAIPVVYGRAKIGGIRVFHETSNNFKYVDTSTLPSTLYKSFISGSADVYTEAETITRPVILAATDVDVTYAYDQSGNLIYETVTTPAVLERTGYSLNRDISGDRHEFLYIQQAISLGTIEEVIDPVIDPNRFYDNSDFRIGQTIATFNSGGTYDPLVSENFLSRKNAKFENINYASMVFRLNRDDPQYNGVPEVSFLVKGRKIKDITYTNSVYSVSQIETYSNNPARVLLDYLTNSLYGLGLDISKIDLQSFYNAKQVCDTIVEFNQPAYGRIWTPSNPNLYTTPAAEDKEWHPFLKQNGVWDFWNTASSSDAKPSFRRLVSLNNALKIYLPAGTHNLTVSVDDTITVLRIDNTNIDFSNTNWYTIKEIPITVTEGLHTLEIDAYNSGGPCSIAITIDDTSLEKNNLFNLRNPALAVSRNIPLYECNLVIDPEKPIRDNIETILETMNSAEFVWSNGKYKLILQYPTSEAEIQYVDTITDDIILKDTFTIKWPNASDKLNSCIIKFSNEGLDFKDDSITWPNKNDTNLVPGTNLNLYNYFLEEDNGVVLESEFYETGIKDFKHALAKAEERVRKSRTAIAYSFKTSLKGMLYEPGDVIKINSQINNVTNTYAQIQEIQVQEDYTVTITAIQYLYQNFAWNATDTEVPPNPSGYPTKVFQTPSNIAFNTNTNVLTWEDASNTNAISYKYYSWRASSVIINNIQPIVNLNISPIFYIKLVQLTKAFYNNDSLPFAIYKSGGLDIPDTIDLYLADSAVNTPFVITQANPSGTVVRNLFLKFINREPELDGYNYWKGLLDDNSKTVAQLIEFFLDTAYANNLYFYEEGEVTTKLANINREEGIYVFGVRGIDLNGNKTAMAISNRFFAITTPSATRTISVTQTNSSFYTTGNTITPASITFEVTANNFINPVYNWFIDGVSQNLNSDTFVLNSFPSGSSKTITVHVTDSTDNHLVMQSFTVSSLADGANPKTVSLSYDNTNFYTPGVTGIPEPNFINFEAIVENFESPSYAWYVDDVLQNAITNVFTLTSFPAGTAKIVKVTVTDTDAFSVSQVLTVPSIGDGIEYDIQIESTNGDIFRVGQSSVTTLIAHIFLNGQEITNSIPASRFRWRRVSRTPQPYPNDDASWNLVYASGFKQIEVTIDSIYAIATFHCDILSE